MSDQIKKAKKLDRINHVAESLKAHGKFSMVPNCIYEMGLSKTDIDLWLYFNRIPSWEHPIVSDLPAILHMKKALILNSLESLSAMNMLVVEGAGKNRKFHIPSPAYWNHPLPKSIYGYAKDEKKPVNIGRDVFTGTTVNRSLGNEKNRSPGNEKENRSPGNEKPFPRERKTVPQGTKRNRQTVGAVSGKASLKTLKDSKDSLKVGWVEEEEQPTKGAVGVIDYVKKVEPLFANPRTGFVPFSELNAVFAEIKAKQGKEAAISFADYLKQIWEASSQGAWLGTGSKKPQDFRLSVLSLPKYLTWWGETIQESLDCASMPH